MIEFDLFKLVTQTSVSFYIPMSYLSIKIIIMDFGIHAFSDLFLSLFGARFWA